MAGGGAFVMITVSHPTLRFVWMLSVTTFDILNRTKYLFTTSKQLIYGPKQHWMTLKVF